MTMRQHGITVYRNIAGSATALKKALRALPLLLSLLILPYFTHYGIASDTFTHLTSLNRAASPAVGGGLTFQGPATGFYAATEPEKDQNRRCLPKKCLKDAVALKERGEHAKSIELLYELRRAWPGTIEAARGALLLALFKIEADTVRREGRRGGSNTAGGAAAAQGALPPIDAFDIDAVKLLKEAAVLRDISQYIDLYRARALNIAGRTELALKVLEKGLGPGARSTLPAALRPLFRYEEAGQLNRLKRPRAERAALTRLIDEDPAHPLVPGSLLRAARISWELNDPGSAYTFANRLRTDHPAAPEAKGAKRVLKWLDQISAGQGVNGTRPGKERYVRAQNLYKAALYKEALEELDSILKEIRTGGADTKKSELYSDAVLLKALTLFRQKSYSKSIKVLSEEMGRIAGKKRPDALYWQAVAALRLGRADLLGAALGELDATPHRKERAWALLFSGRLYEKQGRSKRANLFFRAVINEYSSRPAMHATWHLAWKSYAESRYEESRTLLNRYLEKAGKRENAKAGFYSSDRDKFTYWSARSALKLGRTEEAATLFAKLCANRDDTYYCQMATERLAELGIKEQRKRAGARPAPLYAPAAKKSSRLSSFRSYRAAKELLLLGLNKEAAAELDTLATGLKGSDRSKKESAGLIKEISTLFYASGDYYRGLKLYSKFYRFDTDSKKRAAGTAGAAFSAYPMGVVHSVTRVTKSRGSAKRERSVDTDPLLVAAIMREESTFNPGAISHSGALGLMQIMPDTGDFIAMKLRAPNPERADLLSPVTNIRYGAWYLGYLAKRFKGDITLTIAGYNAGPSAAAKWAGDKKLKNLNVDEFIESIPYAETRRYTKRVLRSYTAYLDAAGLDTATRFSRPIILSSPAPQRPLLKEAPVKVSADEAPKPEKELTVEETGFNKGAVLKDRGVL